MAKNIIFLKDVSQTVAEVKLGCYLTAITVISKNNIIGSYRAYNIDECGPITPFTFQLLSPLCSW